MTDEINGFAIEQSSSHRHLFRRVTEPRHEYIFEITSKRIVLRATLLHVGVDRGDALDDAERSERDAQKAAEPDFNTFPVRRLLRSAQRIDLT